MSPPPTRPVPSRARYLARRVRGAFTLDGFAVAPIWAQQLIVFVMAALVVAVFVPLVGSFAESFNVFMEPAGLADLGGWAVAFGFVELVIGVMVMSFVISLLSSALDQFIGKIKQGTLAFKRSNHFVVLNANEMLLDVLLEIDERAAAARASYEVVILVDDADRVAKAREALVGKGLKNLDVYIRQGDPYNVESYRRINFPGAIGALLLQDEGEAGPFAGDNRALKVLFLMAGWEEFNEAVKRRLAAKSPFKFVVEVNGTTASQEIVSRLASVAGAPPFTAVHPEEIADRLLSRSIVDVAYYRIFQELFSFTGHQVLFVDPAKAGQGAVLAGRRFDEACLGFDRGVLIGLSRFREGAFDVLLCPMEETVRPGDWMVLVAEDEAGLSFDPSKKLVPPSVLLPQPSEFVSRRICMIGDHHAFPSLTAFLDGPSQAAYVENVIVLPRPEDYLQKELIERARAGAFDSVVINLEEEVGFRLTALVRSMFPPGDPFLETIVTVIESPLTDEILNAGLKVRNTILSQKLCAKYLAQVLFQKTLDKVIRELWSPEGYELNLLEVGSGFPREALADKEQVKQLLLASGMVYAGLIDHDKAVHFDGDDFSRAKTIIVLAKGEM